VRARLALGLTDSDRAAQVIALAEEAGDIDVVATPQTSDDVITVLAHTEFWSTQAEPNALVQTNIADTARLIAALERHTGEIERNPYHLRLPAFLADAVRRGGELVLGAGEEVPDFAFATLYRLVAYRAGQPVAELPRRVFPADQALTSDLLKS